MLFYLIGIKGSAMSALAKILYQLGHIVKGVDVEEEFYTIKNTDNIPIETFSNMNLKKSYYYIIGNAYQEHSVTKFLKNKKYKYEMYPRFLDTYFKDKQWICVSGTHGKTTTTKMLAELLPNSIALIGDGSYQVGNKNIFLLEACEYKNTFLNYSPDISVILNVDYDHTDFFKTKEDYQNSFLQFARQSKICIINGDEFNYRNSNVITYGMSDANDVVFTYDRGKVTILRTTFQLPVVGKKYAYDFVGAYLASKLLDVKDFQIQRRISNFKMPKRRYEKTNLKNQILVSDYAHHPNEIKTIYETLREEYGNKKLICIFEPHTITRLQCFIDEFKNALSLFDECYLYTLFSSVREAHNLVLEKQLYKTLDFPLYDYHTKNKLLTQSNVVLCFMGAGCIDRACKEYIEEKKILIK